ncbi:MAG: glycosyltransferase [Clostridiaceae bacterium]|nr:glycosyltransferase [Clostridiaceae bacterium]
MPGQDEFKNSDRILTVTVPAFNTASWLSSCLDSLLLPDAGNDLEVIIVNDGSTDATRQIAEQYVVAHPETFRLIDQENGGYGAAVSSGLATASGRYFYVLDSDDRLDSAALLELLTEISADLAATQDIDLYITNTVYENAFRGKRRRMHFRGMIPTDRVFSWEAVRFTSPSKFLSFHCLTYNTDILRAADIVLPRHISYVDNLLAWLPLPACGRLRYLDLDLYRYSIGRSDQSINPRILVSRIDQHLAINCQMIECMDFSDPRISPALRRYLLRYLAMICAISTIHLALADTTEAELKRRDFWSRIRESRPRLYRRLRYHLTVWPVNLPGRFGRFIARCLYRLTRYFYHFA